MVTDQVHKLLQKAKHSIEEGQRAYEEAGQRLHSQTHEFHGKTVKNVNRTAVMIEQDVVHPIVELVWKYVLTGIRRPVLLVG